MTGFLSVLALLPVRQLQQHGEEEEDEQARKRKQETGRGVATGALSPDPQDTSSDVITTERYTKKLQIISGKKMYNFKFKTFF